MSNPLSAAVGRITAAVATAHNENSLSLANINFDFTLVKLPPPKEYDGLGTSISGRRKLDAEDGELHRTARRLGALFEIILPATPALFRAYGQRVSEISQSELVTPQASGRHGIFTKELGADCTSIWAAVTSGDGSIAAHLLGCMLARMFTIEQATSIWDELVRTQKQWIHHESAKATYSNKYDAAIVAAQQTLSRTELGKWDASARSWLESADLVKAREHKQLMLILDNASVPINSEINVYKSVTKAWCEALKAMDDLVQGIPQQVQDGAVLLAISAWHLYPNLTVLGCGLGTTEVQQRDKIFPDTAVITLGIRVINESQKSVSWSLPLAYLRFYGKPVKTLRSVGQENSRVSMDEFAYIVVGCVFGGWGAFAKSFEEGSQWLERIMELIRKKDSNKFPLVEEVHSEHFWLSHLWNAVNRLRGCNEIDRKFAMQLYALGERRPKFLSGQLEHPPPLFGLSNMSVLLPMMQSCELRIAFLRGLAKEYNLPNNKFIIRYHTDEEDDVYPYEYTTLDEVETIRPKRFRSGSPKHNVNSSEPPIRWVAVPIETMSAIYHCRRADWEPGRDYLHTPDSCETSHICVLSPETLCPLCYHSLHTSYCAQCSAPRTQHLWARSRMIRGLGEKCRLAVETTLHDQSISHSNRSRYLRFGQGTDFETDLKSFRPDIYNDMSGRPIQKYAEFSFFIGDPKSAAILEIKLASPPRQPDKHPPPAFSRAQLLPSQVKTILRAENINTSRFRDYFLRLESHREVYCGSLKAFAAAAGLFKHLTNATVSATVSSRLLLRSKWVPRDQGSLPYFSLSRPQAFSCISMFDSAACDLDPEALKEVFALSVGSSIYVAEAMLCDPYESTKDTNIRRVIGNLGRAGISLLIPPADPAVREPDDNRWTQINHTKFDGQVEDSFQHTSIHLSFTGYEMPLSIDSGSGHTIDRPASLLETLVSVYDRGSWVADLDMSTLLREPSHDALERLVCSCKGLGHTSKHAFQQLCHDASNLHSLLSWTCIDNWDEFIDPPRSQILVIRAHRNWLARLAFASISVAQGHRIVVLPDTICWKCCIQAIYGNLPESELVGGNAVELKRRIVLIS
jgi:hypothetical protein